MIKWPALLVFLFFFCSVTMIGFLAGRWRHGDLTLLHEWGLAGRRFGTFVTFFLMGGNLYTAYTFIAVPAALFAGGALGFYGVPYSMLTYPLIFLVMPRFWTVAKRRGYLTAADFVHDRFGSRTLALLVALTGILATMPYVALQMFGIEVSTAQLGISPGIALTISFFVMATYTYMNGLRAPALIALVKDMMIFIVLLATIVYIPFKLGGFGNIFAAAHQKALQAPQAFHELLGPTQYVAYATLIVGSAFAQFLYPHSLTCMLSSSNHRVIKRMAFLLPLYSLMLGLLALLGYMALAAHIKPQGAYQANGAVPALFTAIFPSWFAGFALAAISIGALVPASVMSISAAKLFTRHVYREYWRRQVIRALGSLPAFLKRYTYPNDFLPDWSEAEESRVAKLTSTVVKYGALLFILFLPATNVINFQLLGGIWILQTLPAVFLGLYTNWFHRSALIAGWVLGMVTGTLMVISQNFAPIFPLSLGGFSISSYAAVIALIFNLVLVVVLTPLLRAIGVPSGRDKTRSVDYDETQPEPEPEPILEQLT